MACGKPPDSSRTAARDWAPITNDMPRTTALMNIINEAVERKRAPIAPDEAEIQKLKEALGEVRRSLHEDGKTQGDFTTQLEADVKQSASRLPDGSVRADLYGLLGKHADRTFARSDTSQPETRWRELDEAGQVVPGNVALHSHRLASVRWERAADGSAIPILEIERSPADRDRVTGWQGRSEGDPH